MFYRLRPSTYQGVNSGPLTGRDREDGWIPSPEKDCPSPQWLYTQLYNQATWEVFTSRLFWPTQVRLQPRTLALRIPAGPEVDVRAKQAERDVGGAPQGPPLDFPLQQRCLLSWRAEFCTPLGDSAEASHLCTAPHSVNTSSPWREHGAASILEYSSPCR